MDPSLVPEELYPQYALGFSRLEEALNCYERAGMDALDLEMTLRRAFGFPPVECDEDEHSPWAWGDRVKVLARMPYTEYLKTPEWAEQRRRAKARAGGRCQGCADTRYLETHHVTYENRGQELPEDLTVLCAQCHTAVHLVADAKRGKVRSESRRV